MGKHAESESRPKDLRDVVEMTRAAMEWAAGRAGIVEIVLQVCDGPGHVPPNVVVTVTIEHRGRIGQFYVRLAIEETRRNVALWVNRELTAKWKALRGHMERKEPDHVASD